MLRTAFRDGWAAVRAAGWRAYALALLGCVLAVAASAVPLLGLVAVVPQTIVLLALVRVLGASRPEPVPVPPQVDEEGRRVLPPVRPGPALSEADRRPLAALRNAGALWLPALRLTGIVLLALIGGIFTVALISGGRLTEYSPEVMNLTALPVSALFLAFIALAPQRIALEGDPRVLVAVAHSVRIARTAYGVLLLITVLEPLVSLSAALVVPDKDPPLELVLGVTSAGALLAAALQVVTTAVANELFLRGPRLELPVDPG